MNIYLIDPQVNLGYFIYFNSVNFWTVPFYESQLAKCWDWALDYAINFDQCTAAERILFVH